MKTRILLIAALAVLLTGCFGALQPSLDVSISPNPLKFKYDETSKEVTLTLTTKGVGKLTVDKAVLLIVDPDGETVWDAEFEIDQSSLVIPGVEVPHTKKIDLPEELTYPNEDLYNQELKGKTYKLIITITGSMDDPIVKEFEVVFE